MRMSDIEMYKEKKAKKAKKVKREFFHSIIINHTGKIEKKIPDSALKLQKIKKEVVPQTVASLLSSLNGRKNCNRIGIQLLKYADRIPRISC